jgi:GNAT superfamily N-acetyltransferase
MASELEDRVDAGIVGAWRGRATGVDGGEALELDGLVLALTNLPADDQNVALVERDPADPVEALRRAEEEFRARGRQFGVKIVVGRTPGIESAVRELGLRRILVEPVMAAAVSDLTEPTPLAAVEVRRATTGPDLAAAVEIEMGVFGTTREIAEALVPPSVAEDPNVRAYVATLGGEPVAGAHTRRHERTVGVFGVGTIDRARRRGIGGALTAFVVRDHRDVADVAWLESSDLGRPVYERIGFRTIAYTEVWVRPRPSTASVD